MICKHTCYYGNLYKSTSDLESLDLCHYEDNNFYNTVPNSTRENLYIEF